MTKRAKLAGFPPSVGCVILAAGASTRFRGMNKLLAKLRGKTLVQHAIDAACSSRALYCAIVVGADSVAIEMKSNMRRCAVIENPNWREGIASSIRCALHYRSDDDATIFLVADEPFVATADIDALIAAHDVHREEIIALRAGAVWGTPTLFPRHDYPMLTKLRGDRGAKTFAKTHLKRMRFVAASNMRAFVDVDEPADLKAVRSNMARAG